MLWLLAFILVIVGIVGTVVPGLPGPILVFAGVLLAAWGDGFARIGAGTLILLALMTIAAYAVDFAASAVGVRLAGASTRAAVGAALGAVAGLFFGLPGLILGPFVGAVLGELTVRRSLPGARTRGTRCLGRLRRRHRLEAGPGLWCDRPGGLGPGGSTRRDEGARHASIVDV